jgi:hypothetical protein
MDKYLTEIENTSICGPNIEADSMEEAQKIADTYNLTAGKLVVIGKLIEELEYMPFIYLN